MLLTATKMANSIKERQLENRWFIYTVTALLSLLGSIVAYANMVTTSSDGAIYLVQLTQMLEDKSSGATDAFGNPYYFLWLLKELCLITGLSAETGAYTFCTAAFAAASIGFVFLVRSLTKNTAMTWMAVVLIVLYPGFNEWKSAIFRDSAFWACSLMALGMLLRFDQERRTIFIVFWLIFQLSSLLFRLEGIAFFWLPILFLKDIKWISISSMTRPVPLIALTFATLALLFVIFGNAIFGGTGILDNVISRALALSGNLAKSSEVLINSLLNTHSDQHATGFLLAGFVYLNLASIFKGLGFLVIALIVIRSHQKRLAEKLPLVFWASLATWCAVLFLFTIESKFMTERYTTLLCLLLMTWGVVNTSRLPWSTRTKAITSMVLAFLLFIDSFISFGYSKQFMLEAKSWVQENTTEEAVVLSSRRGFTYDVQRFGDNTLLRPAPHELNKRGSKKQVSFDYYVEFVHKGKPTTVKNTNLNLIKEFSNQEGYRALIYKVEN
jgi:hypothetical protein